MNESLGKLLLQQIEADTPILWGSQAKPHFGPEFDRLLTTRLIVEQAPATVWHPCGDCECGAHGRSVEEIDGTLVAVCPVDPASAARLNPEDMRTFTINPTLLIGEMTRNSDLEGEPTRIFDRVWFLGRARQGPPVVLVFSQAAAADPNLVPVLRSSMEQNAIVLLPDSARNGEERGRLRNAGFQTVLISDTIRSRSGSEAGFDLSDIEPDGQEEPHLWITKSGSAVELYGTRIQLPPRPHNLICLLAEAALSGVPIVTRRDIEKALWGKKSVDTRHTADAVRDLREKLAPALPAGMSVAELVQNRPQQGYMLTIDWRRIRLTS